MTSIGKILVPTDFSDLSVKALDEAAGLATQLGAALHLVHVCPVLMYAIADGAVPDAPDFERVLKERLRKRLEDQAERLRSRGLTVTTELVDGDPNREIADLASKSGCDLIAMGSHGRHGVQRWTLGSVAERTVRHAHVPVLTLRS